MNPFKLPHLSGLLKPGPMDSPLSNTILGMNPGIRQHLMGNNSSASSTSPTQPASLDTSRSETEEESSPNSSKDNSKRLESISGLGSAFKQVKPLQNKMPVEKKEKKGGVWRPY